MTQKLLKLIIAATAIVVVLAAAVFAAIKLRPHASEVGSCVPSTNPASARSCYSVTAKAGSGVPSAVVTVQLKNAAGTVISTANTSLTTGKATGIVGGFPVTRRTVNGKLQNVVDPLTNVTVYAFYSKKDGTKAEWNSAGRITIEPGTTFSVSPKFAPESAGTTTATCAVPRQSSFFQSMFSPHVSAHVLNGGAFCVNVLDKNKNPVVGAKVIATLINPKEDDNTHLTERTTDSTGTARFANMPVDTRNNSAIQTQWEIKVTKSGCEDASSGVSYPPEEGQRVGNVTITVTCGGATEDFPCPPKGAVSWLPAAKRNVLAFLGVQKAQARHLTGAVGKVCVKVVGPNKGQVLQNVPVSVGYKVFDATGFTGVIKLAQDGQISTNKDGFAKFTSINVDPRDKLNSASDPLLFDKFLYLFHIPGGVYFDSRGGKVTCLELNYPKDFGVYLYHINNSVNKDKDYSPNDGGVLEIPPDCHDFVPSPNP